ncbi:MAG: hypothetical protein ACJATV_001641 [Granulosicoccus sp.]|jgi:hypothetical protein
MKYISLVSVGVVAILSLIGCKEVRVATDYIQRENTYTKPGANVVLESSQVNLAVAGAQYAINAVLLSGYNSGDVTLSVSSSEGLYIVGGDVNPAMTLTKGKINCPYTVIAAEKGRYYLYMNAKVEKDGQVEHTALVFIVQVGEEDKIDGKQSSQKASSGNDSGVISLPAHEEIIR